MSCSPPPTREARVDDVASDCVGRLLDTCIPLVAIVLPISAFAFAKFGEIVDKLNTLDVFRHLITELPLDAHSQGRPVFDG